MDHESATYIIVLLITAQNPKYLAAEVKNYLSLSWGKLNYFKLRGNRRRVHSLCCEVRVSGCLKVTWKYYRYNLAHVSSWYRLNSNRDYLWSVDIFLRGLYNIISFMHYFQHWLSVDATLFMPAYSICENWISIFNHFSANPEI